MKKPILYETYYQNLTSSRQIGGGYTSDDEEPGFGWEPFAVSDNVMYWRRQVIE